MTEVAVPGRGVATEWVWASGGAVEIAIVADWAGVGWVLRGEIEVPVDGARAGAGWYWGGGGIWDCGGNSDCTISQRR